MAEFCLDCWNKLNQSNYKKVKYIISKDLDLCEGCGKLKQVIVAERLSYYKYKLRYLILPFRIIYITIYILCGILILPYLIHRYKKIKKHKINYI